MGKGYKVYGTFRRLSTPNFWRLQNLDIYSKVHLIPADLLDMGSLLEALSISDPDEVYNLAAQSFVSTAFEQPIGNAEITGLAVTKILESIRHVNPKIKFYQASSSEMYGNTNVKNQNENTPFSPASPYAAAKLYAHEMTNIYRDAYDMFAVSGILFNHESPLRGLEFVSRKITNGVAEISLGLKKHLVLGNLKAKRDWGYAKDYVVGMHKMLQQSEPDDYILATGETHSIQEFLELAFIEVGLNWQEYVKQNTKFMRPAEVDYLIGDYSKAKRILGWEPKTNFKELVKIMIDYDIKRLKNEL